MTAPRPAYDPISLAPTTFWAKSEEERERDFKILRDERRVSWHPHIEGSMIPPPEDSGIWAVTRHADLVEVSKRPQDFCSGQGVIMELIPEFLLEAASSFLATDDLRHSQERAFTDPHLFDVRRNPNPHVGFGGGGPHYCLGVMLARTQLRCLLSQLIHRVPDLEVGEPVRLVGNFMNAIKRLPCQLNLTRRAV